MRRHAGPPPPMRTDAGPFPFVTVDGPGVYEIPVGPVHAGSSSRGTSGSPSSGRDDPEDEGPGLWFVHRGVERLFQGQDPQAAVRLAECVSGDSAIAHNLAYLPRRRGRLPDPGTPRGGPGFRADCCSNSSASTTMSRHRRAVQRRRLRARPGTGTHPPREAAAPQRRDHRAPPAPRRDPARPHRSPEASRRCRTGEIGQRFDDIVTLATSNTVVMDRFKGTAVLSGAGRGRDRARSASSPAPPGSPSTRGSRTPSPISAAGSAPPGSPAGTSWHDLPSGSKRHAHPHPQSVSSQGRPPRSAPGRRRCRTAPAPAGDRRRLAREHRAPR